MNRLTAKRWLLISPVMILIGVISVGFYRWASEPRYQGRTARYWAAQLDGTNFVLHQQAVAALDRTNSEAIPFLTRVVQSRPTLGDHLLFFLYSKVRPRLPFALAVWIPVPRNDWKEARLGALSSLERMGTNALPALLALVETLDVKDNAIRFSAVRVLARHGRSDPKAVQTTTKLLLDSDAGVVLEVAKTFWQTQRRPETVIPALARLAQQSDPVHAFEAVLLLGQVAQQSDLGATALVPALRHVNERVRGTAARVLGNLGRTAKPALSALTNARNDPYSNVRDAAELALQKINADIKSNAGPVKP